MRKYDVIYKGELHNILQCPQSKTEPQPWLTSTENFVNFGHAVFTMLCYASTIYAVVMCLSVRPTVTRQYCTETANTGSHKQRRMIAKGPYFFLMPKISVKFPQGCQIEVIFNKYLTISQKQCKRGI